LSIFSGIVFSGIVMAGLVPAIHAFGSAARHRHGCPRQSPDQVRGWRADWDRTVAAAKKEGRLNFYVGRYGSEPLLNEFRKEFPEIKLVTVNGAGNTLGTRIIAELRAGNVLADLFSGGANTNYEILYEGKALDSIKSTLILPEVLDESKWYEGRHRYTDPDQRHIFVYIANPSSSGFYYNTGQVNPKEFKSYWDLVAPMAKAAVACGADGLIIEVHPRPEEALSDGPQSLKPTKFTQLMRELKPVAEAVGRSL
jgi:ABC-type glycerol-3-phosphate transport system substrate-binding protein